MNISYLRPFRLPATVRVEANVVQSGRTLALVRGRITSQRNDRDYFICEHHKVNITERDL